MIYNKKVLALIPARGGSKGIKDKNIYPIAGKPLIAYSITEAKQSGYIDRVLVSTDSLKIAQISRAWGAEVPFMRPDELAQDYSKSIDVVLHALKWLKDHGENYDILVLLQPTQPLRRTEDIDRALELFVRSGEKGVVSVSEVKDSPVLVRSIDKNGLLKKILSLNSTVRRQDMPLYYRVNGCIYINQISTMDEKTSFNDNPIPYRMPRERSVDVDELSDIVLVNFYLENEGGTR